MKKYLLSLLFSAALVSSMRAVPATAAGLGFTTSQAQFESGDSITIREVLSTSAGLNIGDTVVVRGDYTLQSRSAASLVIQLTSSAPSAGPALATSHVDVAAGTGTFELEYLILQTGALHVTFY